MRYISDLDLKVKLTNEYLRNGGIPKIQDVQLLDDIINTKFDTNGKARYSVYLSTIMFTTLGFGDFAPFQNGSLKIFLGQRLYLEPLFWAYLSLIYRRLCQ
jgi:hypothetical protein